MTWRARAIQVAKLAVVLVALVWLVRTGRLDLRALADLRPGLAAMGAVLVLMPFLITFYRLSVVLRAVGAPVPVRAVYRIGFIAGFFNTFMPGGLGGDLVKVGYLIRLTGDGARATAAVLLDRVLALVSVLAIGGVSLLVFWPTLQSSAGLRGLALLVALGLGGIALGVLVAVPLLSSRRVEAGLAPDGWLRALLTERIPLGRLVLRLVEAARLARAHLGLLGAMVLLSVVSQGCSIASMYLFSRALELPPTFGQIIAAAPLAFLANTLPVPGGGLGVGEAAMASLLELFARDGAPATGGALIFLAWRLWVVIWGLLGLPPYLARSDEIRSISQVTQGVRH
ncbi:MAG: lysylphosphatidylglycerol synthase transmembrane domain-containing protein [Pseudomonadota bacterium]